MHRTAQKFKLAEAAVRYFKYCQGVVRPKSVAGRPSTPSTKLLLVVLTNLRSSGGAWLCHRFFLRSLARAGLHLRQHLQTGLIVALAVPFDADARLFQAAVSRLRL